MAEDQKKRLTVVVTGASQGLGYWAALNLARNRPEWHLILACRAPLDKANAAADQIRKATGHNAIEVSELNLASFDSVRRFSATLLGRLNDSKPSGKKSSQSDSTEAGPLPPLTAIICNAGAQFVKPQTMEGGIEMTFGTLDYTDSCAGKP